MCDLNAYEEGLAIDLELAESRIEELEAKNQETFQMYVDANEARIDAEAKLVTCEKYRDAYAECDRIGTQAMRELEAKLAKLTRAADRVHDSYWNSTDGIIVGMYDLGEALRDARATLAELKGKSDE